MMVIPNPKRRHGISLMEVLISIGVISLGIFGVATLIPVGQFQVAKGTLRQRVATLGRNAVADFRVRDMSNPDNWISTYPIFQSDADTGQQRLIRRGYCIDPMGRFLPDGTLYAGTTHFPGGLNVGIGAETNLGIPDPNSLSALQGMARVTLRNNPDLKQPPVPIPLGVADDIFAFRDDLTFDRPNAQELQPNRQYAVNDADGRPIKSLSNTTLSWFATVTPTETTSMTTNEFILSVVIVNERLRDASLIPLDEGIAVVKSPYAGEIQMLDQPSTDEIKYRVADLRTGDWLLLVKRLRAADPLPVYRWTQIIGADDLGENESDRNLPRTFTIANDDFFKTIGTSPVGGHAIFVRGVVGVVERFIRLENSTAWN